MYLFQIFINIYMHRGHILQSNTPVKYTFLVFILPRFMKVNVFYVIVDVEGTNSDRS